MAHVKYTFNLNVRLTIHWDSKMMEDLTPKRKVDRLAIYVSGENIIKLLGIPTINNGTGKIFHLFSIGTQKIIIENNRWNFLKLYLRA